MLMVMFQKLKAVKFDCSSTLKFLILQDYIILTFTEQSINSNKAM